MDGGVRATRAGSASGHGGGVRVTTLPPARWVPRQSRCEVGYGDGERRRATGRYGSLTAPSPRRVTRCREAGPAREEKVARKEMKRAHNVGPMRRV